MRQPEYAALYHAPSRIIRIAHPGYDIDAFDMIIAMSALEKGLAHCGHRLEFGAGVSAVQKALE